MISAAQVTNDAVSFVRGVAEALPLRDGAANLVWVSTALHHFGDRGRAIDEFARVLSSGGRVLVRTFVPGRTDVTWFDAFPGRPKWERRFHTRDELVAAFSSRGFTLIDVRDVLEWMEPYATSADWVENMRNADSVLTALSDEEIAQGLHALRTDPDRVGRLELTLLVFERHDEPR
jgi:SAM-dependent methyltransferase